MKTKHNSRLDKSRSLERFNGTGERAGTPQHPFEGDQQVWMLVEALQMRIVPSKGPLDTPACGCNTAFTASLAECERCQNFTLLGLLHVIHQMDADPGFARLVKDLSVHCLARQAAPVSPGCAQCAPLLHPVEWVEPLTNRELDVLHLMVERRSYREIAETLFISPLTVKTHVHNVFRKLGVNRRRFAIQRARELGLVRAN